MFYTTDFTIEPTTDMAAKQPIAPIKSFHYLDNGMVTYSPFETLKTVKQLESGSYILEYNQATNSVLIKIDNDVEELRMPKYKDQDVIENYFKAFFNKDVIQKIGDLKLLHKIGILFHGPQGTGKSSIMKHYYQKFIDEQNAIVFHISNGIGPAWDVVSMVRLTQKNPIVIVFDEADNLFTSGFESFIKNIIDGKLSIDNVIFFAATNYIERIPVSIKDRPSRFKYVIKIDAIDNIDVINGVLSNMINHIFSDDDILKMSKSLKGQSLDSIKQFGLDKIMNIDHYKNEKENIGFFNRK